MGKLMRVLWGMIPGIDLIGGVGMEIYYRAIKGYKLGGFQNYDPTITRELYTYQLSTVALNLKRAFEIIAITLCTLVLAGVLVGSLAIPGLTPLLTLTPFAAIGIVCGARLVGALIGHIFDCLLISYKAQKIASPGPGMEQAQKHMKGKSAQETLVDSFISLRTFGKVFFMGIVGELGCSTVMAVMAKVFSVKSQEVLDVRRQRAVHDAQKDREADAIKRQKAVAKSQSSHFINNNSQTFQQLQAGSATKQEAASLPPPPFVRNSVDPVRTSINDTGPSDPVKHSSMSVTK